MALIVLLILAVADLLRPASFLKSLFQVAPASRQEQVIDGVRRRISRVDGTVVDPSSLRALPETETPAG